MNKYKYTNDVCQHENGWNTERFAVFCASIVVVYEGSSDAKHDSMSSFMKTLVTIPDYVLHSHI